jgi:WD40 repeat protein
MGILALAGIAPIQGSDWAFTGNMPGGHRGSVTAVVHKGDILLSAGEDGFLEIWNTRSQAAERFQITTHRIIAMAEKPEKDEVALLESDGMGTNRVSLWNYKERRTIFSLQLRDPIESIFYSMAGKFIIAARTGRTGLVFIDSISGNILQSPQNLSGTVTLAATGRSERNMVVYLTSGSLSYWDLESEKETNRFDVPQNLQSPVLFSNSRYFAGVNAQGLAVVNAVSGELLARDNSIPIGSLLCSAGDELICLIQKEKTAEVCRYTIDHNGHLGKAGTFALPVSGNGDHPYYTTITTGNSRGSIVLGTSTGTLVIAEMNGQPRTLTVKEQILITEAEVSGRNIAFIAANGTIGFISQNYNQFPQRRAIYTEQNPESYNRITAFSEERFIFWQDKNTQTKAVIRSSGSGGNKIPLNDITFRSSIRSVDSLEGKIVFVDSVGNITVTSPLEENKSRPFTFFSVGLMDAVFVDPNQLIIGRSAISGNTPFMVININTGETVPLPYPSPAGVLMHRGASGAIYATAMSSPSTANEADGMRTLILRLDFAHIGDSAKLVDYQGEDTHFSLAESPGGIATTIGGEGAAVYSAKSVQKLERASGLPLKIINGGNCLISLDGDGSICWHDNRSGKLLAIFRLHPDGWTMQTERGTTTGSLSPNSGAGTVD